MFVARTPGWHPGRQHVVHVSRIGSAGKCDRTACAPALALLPERDWLGSQSSVRPARPSDAVVFLGRKLSLTTSRLRLISHDVDLDLRVMKRRRYTDRSQCRRLTALDTLLKCRLFVAPLRDCRSGRNFPDPIPASHG
jgi:hypothetical protein